MNQAPGITELSLSGLNCANCARRATDALQSVSGVASATVALEPESATVRWRSDAAAQPEALVQALQQVGYQASIQPPVASSKPTQLQIRGMNCDNCARQVSEALLAVPGVNRVLPQIELRQATVHWDSNKNADGASLLRALKQAGYEARVVRAEAKDAMDSTQKRMAGWHLNLWIGVLGTVPLMLGEWVFGWMAEPWFRWTSLALAGIVQLFAGAQFYRGAWNQLKVGASNMDTLVSLGSTTAFAYSVWALFSMPGAHLYFMESAAIITLISVGHWMEARVSARASSALKSLLNLAPALARRQNSDGTVTEAPLAELQVDDTVLLKPGDRVPTDGEVLEGESSVDESMLTGESIPVEKTRQSKLYAGTANLNGRLRMRITATGEETALAHIIAAVQRAQTSRASVQRLADRVSNVFVPIVVLVAVATALWWGLAPATARQVHDGLSPWLWDVSPPTTALAAALIGAASVLIIACPCAMGLATPAAIMAGSNAAAKRGILIRDGIALEKAGKVTTIVFDKTGTLTAGKPSVVGIYSHQHSHSIAQPEAALGSPPESVLAQNTTWRDDLDRNRNVVRMAVALAQHSTHPLSQAMAKLATSSAKTARDSEMPQPATTAGVESEGLERNDFIPAIEDWQEVRGAGVQGRLSPGAADGPMTAPSDLAPLFRLGALNWLHECRVDYSTADSFVEEWTAQGATVLGLAAGSRFLGAFALKDDLKPGAREVVSRLRHHGAKICLVTGDNQRTASGIARQINLPPDAVFAEVRPEQKAEFVKQLQQQGERVAFVGDGINDAPALEQADLGIAVGQASDVAREAADIILLRSDIEAVPESLGLARATLRTIHQNLFWAFFYNAIGIPLAALGFMSPVLCAVAMGFSDLVVIGNALRLRRWKMKSSPMNESISSG